MNVENKVFHCILIFNSHNEPIFTIYDDYMESVVISPHRSGLNDSGENMSVENIIMQIFTPLLASQSAMMDMLNTRFRAIDLSNNKTLVMNKIHNCYLVILLSDQCLYRKHESIVTKKLELIEWLISSFYGICWDRMAYYSNSWLKVVFKEMWRMDETEFNLTFWCNERIDFNPQLNLTKKVMEVLVENMKYLRNFTERKMKHQLVLVGSKLFCLYSCDSITDLKPRHTLLFVLICNAMFNRFSRAREPDNDETIKVYKSNGSVLENASPKNSSISSSSDDISSGSIDEIGQSFRSTYPTMSNKSSSSPSFSDPDPFILWIENKDRYKYKIVKIFLKYRAGYLKPCYLHLVKLARNVIYIGVEENSEQNATVSTLDKSIRLMRNIMLDNEKRKDVTSILKSRISPSIDKLIDYKIIHWKKLSQARQSCLANNNHNPDYLERVLKELLRILESIYCQYYLSFPIEVSDRLCKSFLRCFVAVKKEMYDFLAILSVKALRNLPPTSFYPLYPGLIHFVLATRKVDPLIVSPVFDLDVLKEVDISRFHFLVQLCRNISSQFDVSMSLRQIEVCAQDIRCTYHGKKYQVSDDRYHEFELVLFHYASVSTALVKKQLRLLLAQFTSDSNEPDHLLLNMTS